MTPNELKALRLEKKMTQQQMAEMLGVSVRTLIYWEKGEREIPTHVQKYAQSSMSSYEQTGELNEIFKKFSFDYMIDKVVSERISGMESQLEKIQKRIEKLEEDLDNRMKSRLKKISKKNRQELEEIHQSVYTLLKKSIRFEKFMGDQGSDLSETEQSADL